MEGSLRPLNARRRTVGWSRVCQGEYWKARKCGKAGTKALLTAAVALATLAPVTAEAQMPGMTPADPDMPKLEGFDAERAIFWERRNFDPLRDPEWTSLEGARRTGNVADDTPVVVFEAGGQTLVLVTSQMSYHHVAQGEMAGEPWMVTF